MEKLRINVAFLLASFVIVLANLSTKQLLECRANLTTTIKNDTAFLEKVHQADYIFTGKIKELRRGQLHVRVKRAIKGLLNSTLDLALNDSCSAYIRRSYTGIFMGRRDSGFGDLQHVGRVVMHFGPVPLTLANLDRLDAAVRVKLTTFLAILLISLLLAANVQIGQSLNRNCPRNMHIWCPGRTKCVIIGLKQKCILG